MSNVSSSKERENIYNFDREIYSYISDALVKYMLDRKWFDSKEISDAIGALCNQIKIKDIDTDIGYALIKRLVAEYVEYELDSMLDKHFINQQYSQIDFGRISFSERLLKGFT